MFMLFIILFCIVLLSVVLFTHPNIKTKYIRKVNVKESSIGSFNFLPDFLGAIMWWLYSLFLLSTFVDVVTGRPLYIPPVPESTGRDFNMPSIDLPDFPIQTFLFPLSFFMIWLLSLFIAWKMLGQDNFYDLLLDTIRWVFSGYVLSSYILAFKFVLTAIILFLFGPEFFNFFYFLSIGWLIHYIWLFLELINYL